MDNNRFSRILSRALDDIQSEEQREDDAKFRERDAERDTAEKQRAERQLRALEQLAHSFSRIAEAFDRATTSGLNVHVHTSR